MPFTIVRQDITKMPADAIVNAANTALQMGGGVCGAIFRAAGVARLQAACAQLAPIKTGEAVLTEGFNLPAKYIIHTAGPVYQDGKQGEAIKLRSCYLNSMKLAAEKACESIAFPLISSGIYGYPQEEALEVATGAIQEFLEKHDLQVYLAVIDPATIKINARRLHRVTEYLKEYYVESPLAGRTYSSVFVAEKEDSGIKLPPGLLEVVGKLDESFATTLFRLIDGKGQSEVEVYKRANLDRRLFSKIRSEKGYMPSKRTVIALAVALELTLEETGDLLERAGYALSPSKKFDVIVEYFIVQRKYNILEINEVLFKFDQPLLGG